MFYIVDFGSLYTYVKIYQCVHVDLCILLNVDYNSILRMKKNKSKKHSQCNFYLRIH